MTEVTKQGLIAAIAAISALKIETNPSVLNHLAATLADQESIYLYFQAQVLLEPELDSNLVKAFNTLVSKESWGLWGLLELYNEWLDVVLTQKRFVFVRKLKLEKALSKTIVIDDIDMARVENRSLKVVVLSHSRFGKIPLITAGAKLESISDTINQLKSGSHPHIPNLGQYSTGTFERRYQQGFQRERVPSDVQRIVWERDNGRCVMCGSIENLQFDHIIPVSRGGNNSAANIQILCRNCNLRKSNRIGG